MAEETYMVEIEESGQGSSGDLIYDLDKYAQFSPDTILGDIAFAAQELIEPPNFDETDIKAQLFNETEIEFENKFGQIFGIPTVQNVSIAKRQQYIYAAILLRQIIHSNEYLTLNKLEQIKTFLGLGFSYSISLQEHNLKSQEFIPEDGMRVYRPLQYGFYSAREIFNAYVNKPHMFIYNCYSKADVLFSVLHYLAFNGYKFYQCQHCEKYFATKNFKKFCKRKSPFKGFEYLECQPAAKAIRRKLSRRRKGVLNNLGANYEREIYEKFSSDCNLYIDNIKEQASCKNLALYESFLSRDNIAHKYYLDSMKNTKTYIK